MMCGTEADSSHSYWDLHHTALSLCWPRSNRELDNKMNCPVLKLQWFLLKPSVMKLDTSVRTTHGTFVQTDNVVS